MISIRKRRQEDRIQRILTAASVGDVAELKFLMKVNCVEISFLLCLICGNFVLSMIDDGW